MSRRTLLLVVPALVVLTSACARSVLAPPRPALPAGGWVLQEIPGDRLLVSTPPGFNASNASGCFEGHTQDTLRHGPGWRSFCLRTHPPSEPIPVFTEGPQPDCAADCLVFDDVRTTRMTLGRQDVIVQTAFVSGGFAGRRRSPEMLVQIPIPMGLALFRAQYGDRTDAGVLLGIAQTITTR